MNYIILNGKKSTELTGLIIQSLPHISKPQMRTLVDEIDGRDGDIATKLGYAAYDKELSVGLYGKFNIDDVISYFDSEGTVTFSNEPDKFYYYRITDQIDFERLVRFRTATVTLHCQPYKYALAGRLLTVNNQLIQFDEYSQIKNGVTLIAKNDRITVSGTASTATEFYIPIDKITLEAGNYTLLATAIGSKAESCSLRLVKAVASNADSFGYRQVSLATNGTVEITETVYEREFAFIWISVKSGYSPDIQLHVALSNDDVSSAKIFNRGNTIAKPAIRVHGSGTVDLSLNGTHIFTIAIGTLENITIDAEELEAYSGDYLVNRLVSGDYNKLALAAGSNVLAWSGNVTKLEIMDYSRWI